MYGRPFSNRKKFQAFSYSQEKERKIKYKFKLQSKETVVHFYTNL